MKRIVILCDGTWNTSDSSFPTNVVRVAQAMQFTDKLGMEQVPIYVPGVGSGHGVSKLARWQDKILGGALGWGLTENIASAYRALRFAYNQGDEIYIFGFSRGAYTARSLCGLIRTTGLIERDQLHLIPAAIERYTLSGKDVHPNSEESHKFRLKVSPRYVTSSAEAKWRADCGIDERKLLKVTYLGVWDSVGALGVPEHLLLASILNRKKYEFHDANLSSLVSSARHAIALDERRKTFQPTLWSNMDELNHASGHDALPYQEKYFAGDHGSVGGGGDIVDLSSIALMWVLEGAEKCGLEIRDSAKEYYKKLCNPFGPLTNSSKKPRGFINLITRFNPIDRIGPDNVKKLDHSVIQRWTPKGLETKSGRPFYRPRSLSGIERFLDEMLEGKLPPE